MGDLLVDTAVSGSDGHYAARLSPEWEVWGPNGGYLSAIALRASGQATAFTRPASFGCHYLNVATFDDVQLCVQVLRSGKHAESRRVAMRQGDVPILDALVWVTDQQKGLQHVGVIMPDHRLRTARHSGPKTIGATSLFGSGETSK